MSKRKKIRSNVTRNLLLLIALTLWVMVVLFAFMVLKKGGHLSPRAADQELLGTFVEGVVADSSGRPVVGAKVVIEVGDKRNVYLTGENGNYKIYNFLEGEYEATITKAGYLDLKTKVNINSTASIQNFTLTSN